MKSFVLLIRWTWTAPNLCWSLLTEMKSSYERSGCRSPSTLSGRKTISRLRWSSCRWLKINNLISYLRKIIEIVFLLLLISFYQECNNLVKIEDILPFFPDFVTIDHFKDAICDSLQDYSKHISELKEEMEDAYRYLHSHAYLFQINHESTSKIHSTSHSVVWTKCSRRKSLSKLIYKLTDPNVYSQVRWDNPVWDSTVQESLHLRQGNGCLFSLRSLPYVKTVSPFYVVSNVEIHLRIIIISAPCHGLKGFCDMSKIDCYCYYQIIFLPFPVLVLAIQCYIAHL